MSESAGKFGAESSLPRFPAPDELGDYHPPGNQEAVRDEAGLEPTDPMDLSYDPSSSGANESSFPEVGSSSAREGFMAIDRETFERVAPAAEASGDGSTKPLKAGKGMALTKKANLRQRCLDPTLDDSTSSGGKSLSRGVLLSRKIVRSVQDRGSFQPHFSWCILTDLVRPKSGSSPQVSWESVNKFASLGELLIWAQGNSKYHLETLFTGEGNLTLKEAVEVSHLCHQPSCTVRDHVSLESGEENNARKGCVVFVDCSPDCRSCGGKKVIMICPHVPHCIKWHPRYTSMEDLEDNGICRDAAHEVRNRQWLQREHYEGRNPSQDNPLTVSPSSLHGDDAELSHLPSSGFFSEAMLDPPSE